MVGVIGGVPKLPGRLEWPEWDGHGPLSFVAGVDCRALAGQTLRFNSGRVVGPGQIEPGLDGLDDGHAGHAGVDGGEQSVSESTGG